MKVLGHDGPRDPRAPRPPDPAAQDRYSQALACLKRSDREAMVDGAITLLEGLTASDQASGTQFATLARAYLHKYSHARERIWEARAATAAHRALQLAPHDPEVLVPRGDVAAGTGQYERALTAYREARDVGASVDCELGAIRALADSGRVLEAEVAAGTLARHVPDDWRVWSM